jgi:hypothetical protein
MPTKGKGGGGGGKKYDPKSGKKKKDSDGATGGVVLSGYMPDVVEEVEQESNTDFGVIVEVWDPKLAAILGGEL